MKSHVVCMPNVKFCTDVPSEVAVTQCLCPMQLFKAHVSPFMNKYHVYGKGSDREIYLILIHFNKSRTALELILVINGKEKKKID